MYIYVHVYVSIDTYTSKYMMMNREIYDRMRIVFD